MSTKNFKVFSVIIAVAILALSFMAFIFPETVSAAAMDRQGGLGVRGGYGKGDG